MPDFQYKGRDLAGELVVGRLQGVSAAAVATELSGSNITPIDITEARPRPAVKPKPARKASRSEAAKKASKKQVSGWGRGKVGMTELVIFSRQMFSLTKAGMPLDRALRGLEASIQNAAMKNVLRDVGAQLEKGQTLTDALSRHPRVFSPLYLSLVNVGENTGRLDLAFQQIGRYLELEQNTVKQVKSATRYPAFVLVAIAVALTLIMMFVIPVFSETFAQLNAELPWQTQLLIQSSDFFVNWWPLMLGGVVSAWVAFRQYVKTPFGRRAWDRRKLALPLAGNIFERVALSRFARTFSMMMKTGVPIVQSLNVIARAVGNKYVGDNVEKMKERIAHGESLYRSAVKTGMFSPLVLQMIAVGEESGNVDELLEEVADFYDSEIEYDLKKLGSAIEPILIVFIAGIVLLLALGVFLPIWDLSNAAQ